MNAFSTYVLILFAHVGPMGNGNSNALATQEFNTPAKCQKAGQAAVAMANGTVKKIEFVCVEK